MKQKVKILCLAIIFVVSPSIVAYVIDNQVNDIRYDTQKIMETVPLHCYLFYPNLNDKQPNSMELTYYKDMGIALNNTGIKYPLVFMRSAAFHGYLIENCPFLNQTKDAHPPTSFQSSLALQNANRTLSDSWTQAIKTEQSIHDYGLASNPKNFVRIEDGASAFGIPIPEFTDQFFLPWNNVLDINKYENVTSPTGSVFHSDFIGCKNPSWRANSDIRQCDWWHSHWIINVHTQEFMGIIDPPPVNATESKS